MAGGLGLLLAGWWRLPRPFLLALAVPLALSLLYSPQATALLSGWLMAQMPPSAVTAETRPIAVLVGRGPAIAAATTGAAADRLLQGQVAAVYVSGDERATAERLLSLGVNPELVSGDACARTTWENATLTAAWLQKHHPGAPVLLITDPWQLPRAAHAFSHQGLQVYPLAAEPSLSPTERNKLALRETVATMLYRVQGRI
ncbi:MAG: YdcF family protein [Cyanobacteriota bacterium]|nr:YdcF family protein [Cyanobacteriota bacterium]